ncbi:MAG: TIGR03668 family PPOX class F420-dependent oxidoreductase [Candidatus Eremiobacteraeota bacterium]|nr:TIGR03668 family PPOX class F420-dependent oxidoreductase [Candidatus Eremiobacteraeota bacterium]
MGRLASCDEQGRPHCVPVCFVVHQGQLVIAMDEKPKSVGFEKLRRVRNIRQNPQVSVLVDHYEEDWSQLGFVFVEGRAELAELGTDVIQALRQKYPQYEKMELEVGIFISPERTSGWGRLK